MHGYTLDKGEYIVRLRKIEGQVRGLQRLIDDDTYCIVVLTQIASVNAALKQVALGLVDQHLRHCVLDAMTAERSRTEHKGPAQDHVHDVHHDHREKRRARIPCSAQRGVHGEERAAERT